MLETFQQYKESENHLETQSPILIHIFPDLKTPIRELFYVLIPLVVTGLYTLANHLNGCILLHINYISIKLAVKIHAN